MNKCDFRTKSIVRNKMLDLLNSRTDIRGKKNGRWIWKYISGFVPNLIAEVKVKVN